MIQNCTLYLPIEKLNFSSIFTNIKSNGGIFKKPTYFEYKIDDCTIKLNIMPGNEISNHLMGFKNYVSRLDNDDKDKEEAKNKINQVKNVLGVSFSSPVDSDSNAFASLMYIIETFKGLMFIYDSILLPDGKFLVGPLSKEDEENMTYPVQINPEDFRHERNTDGIPKELVEMREKNYCTLAEYGFTCARWLPININTKVRPPIEIASRLYALNTLVMWVTFPENVLPTEAIVKLIERYDSHKWLTKEESDILNLSRPEAKEQNMDSIGWRFENMWPLAWILGFNPPPLFYVGQMPEEISTPMLLKFLPENQGPEQLISKNMLRSESEIIEMEDLFYCAHNAVRSAQNGGETVPRGFHPVGDGGAIHERRHSLTWSLYPGITWEETDLST